MELAQAELERSVQLVAEGHLPRENLDRAQAEARRAEASVRSARFSVDVARHERDSARASVAVVGGDQVDRSEEHTSELQSRGHLVCRLLLEKKNNNQTNR